MMKKRDQILHEMHPLGVRGVCAVIFLVFIISFPRSYLFLKLIFLLIFVAIEVIWTTRTEKFRVYSRIYCFYILVISVGCVWSAIGLIYGNPDGAIYDHVRLYIIWSFAYLLIFSMLRAGDRRYEIHLAIVISGFLISAVNLIGLFDYGFQLGLITEEMRKELDMYIGFHDGYVQIMSHNVGALFFIVPYLLVLFLRQDAEQLGTRAAKLSLLLCILVTFLSGRRALWICLALTPLLIILASYATKAQSSLTRRGRLGLLVYVAALFSAPFLAAGLLASEDVLGSSTFRHLLAAFSEEDERSIQLGYLIESFKQYPLFGSGFGGYAGYTRNEVSPWLYELTYFQLLFNIGIAGVLYVGAIFVVYFYFVLYLLRRYPEGSATAFASVVGISSFLIGTYSNPYLGSFDFLLYLGLLPFLSSYTHGFMSQRPDLSQKKMRPDATNGRFA